MWWCRDDDVAACPDDEHVPARAHHDDVAAGTDDHDYDDHLARLSERRIRRLTRPLRESVEAFRGSPAR
jgi:hypothetical protein